MPFEKTVIIPMPICGNFLWHPRLFHWAKKDPWSRPHIRLVYTLAHYNDYARDHNYSPYLQVNQKSWGSYVGVKTEWWLF